MKKSMKGIGIKSAVLVIGFIVLLFLVRSNAYAILASEVNIDSVPGKTVNDVFDGGYDVTVKSSDIISKGPWVDVRAYASFSAAIDAIGLSNATLLIPNEQVVSANKTVPSNVDLQFVNPGRLSINAGVTVTINGSFNAGLYQIFSGAGSVVFGSVKEVYPQWWGAKGDGTTDNTTAITAAYNATPDGAILRFVQGGWMFTGLNITKNIGIVGSGTGTVLINTGTGYALSFDGTANTLNNVFVNDLRIKGNAVNAGGIDLNRVDRSTFKNIVIQTDVNGIGVRLRGALLNTFNNLVISTNPQWPTYPPGGFNIDTGIQLTENANRISSLANTFVNAVLEGIPLGVDHVTGTGTFYGGAIEGNTVGMNVTTSGGLSLLHTAIESNGQNVTGCRNCLSVFDATGIVGVQGMKIDRIELGVGEIDLNRRTTATLAMQRPATYTNGGMVLELIPRGSADHTSMFRVYKTDMYADDTNFEAFEWGWLWGGQSNFLVRATRGGTGVQRYINLQTIEGVSGTTTPAKNLRGSVTISDFSTSGTVTFGIAEINTAYFVTATVSAVSGTPATGSTRAHISNKTTTGFTVELEVAPGTANSVTVDWILIR